MNLDHGEVVRGLEALAAELATSTPEQQAAFRASAQYAALTALCDEQDRLAAEKAAADQRAAAEKAAALRDSVVKAQAANDAAWLHLQKVSELLAAVAHTETALRDAAKQAGEKVTVHSRSEAVDLLWSLRYA